jgi:hypothetical protein
MLAAVASTSDTVFRPQYLKRLEHAIRRDVRLRKWEFYLHLVRRYLWWDYLLDPLAWEAFTAVSWQDIDDTTDMLSDQGQSQVTQAARPQVFSWRLTSRLEHSLVAIP